MWVTFKKLEDDTWGVSGKGEPPAPGDIVQVKKKDGTTDDVEIAEMLDDSGQYWIASIVKKPKGAQRTAAPASKTPPPAWAKLLGLTAPPRSADEIEAAFAKLQAARKLALEWLASKGLADAPAPQKQQVEDYGSIPF